MFDQLLCSCWYSVEEDSDERCGGSEGLFGRGYEKQYSSQICKLSDPRWDRNTTTTQLRTNIEVFPKVAEDKEAEPYLRRLDRLISLPTSNGDVQLTTEKI